MLRLARRLIVREDGVSVVEGALLLALIGSALAAVVPSIPIGTGFTGISAVIARKPADRPGAEVYHPSGDRNRQGAESGD